MRKMPVDPIQLSKFLSFVLRHKPDEIGLTLSPEGWANIDELVEKANMAGTNFARADLLDIVARSDKKRFSLSADGLSIRAAQGHSVPVDLGLPSQEPPSILYHGTATRFVEAILSEGLKPQARQQVHPQTRRRRSASVSAMASHTSSRSMPAACTSRDSSFFGQTMACG